ncbi:MAG: ABC transporter ATP-binding protein [Armatimonadetes bacterium]|nr:ABC transporter ATP-binding protein [Armatimonadota bacterium]
MPLLEVRNLRVAFGAVEVLRGVSFSVEAGHTLGVVGESGCGKSMTGLAVMGMLPATARILDGEIILEGRNLLELNKRDWLDVRGQEVAMVMQDPFTSLNPMMRVGDQIAEVYNLHKGFSWSEGRRRAVDMLDRVGVPVPEESARKYPHQMSGGQRQRVVIACAFAAQPKVLIADEPTTALDVTLQAQILRLLNDLQSEFGTAVVLISHDIGVIGSVAEEVSVFYAGRVVENGTVEQVLRSPKMPYTQALLQAMPRRGQGRLAQISGQPPDFAHMPQGCAFGPRCPHRFERCDSEPNLLDVDPGHTSACWLVEQPSAVN